MIKFKNILAKIVVLQMQNPCGIYLLFSATPVEFVQIHVNKVASIDSELHFKQATLSPYRHSLNQPTMNAMLSSYT